MLEYCSKLYQNNYRIIYILLLINAKMVYKYNQTTIYHYINIYAKTISLYLNA